MSYFKYISSEIAEFLLENQQIRFTQPIAFNDPYDVFPKMSNIISDEKINELFFKLTSKEDIINEVIDKTIEEHYHKLSPSLRYFFSIIPLKEWFMKEIKNRYGSISDFIFDNLNKINFREQLIYQILYMISNFIGILSLSKINNSLLMWSHYSNCHKGVVLEFDNLHPFFKQFENSTFSQEIEIEYSGERPEILIDTLEYTPEEAMKLSKKMLFTKSNDWSYEKEYRIIRYLNSAKKLTYHDKNDYEIFVFDFPKEIIKGIIFGSKIDNNKKENILSLLADKGYKDVVISQASLNQNKYFIDIVAI